jgi:hypothetical protein
MNKLITHKHGTKIQDQEFTIIKDSDKNNSILLVRILYFNLKYPTVRMQRVRAKPQDLVHIRPWSQLKRKLMSIRE